MMTDSQKTHLCIVLHAHLPYLRQAQFPHCLEERWLFEAITESYIPQLELIDKLVHENLPVQLTITLTPPLCEMLCDGLLRARYGQHLETQLLLANREVERLNDTPFHKQAIWYLERYERTRSFWQACSGELLEPYKHWRRKGIIKVLTSAATHGFLPNLRFTEGAVEAQLEIGVRNYHKHFGEAPKGIWLSECGYFPGLDKSLKKAGLEYFFVDTHGLLQADAIANDGVYAPVLTAENLACFARDPASSREVWSAQEGYPGDGRYRDFYGDIGHELDMEYIRDFIDPAGIRVDTGFKYNRIGDRSGKKEIYELKEAQQAVEEHASHFIKKRVDQHHALLNSTTNTPCILCPYDAELFGHWWHEGPSFLESVIREACKTNELLISSPEHYLSHKKDLQRAAPGFSSWGSGGYAKVWLNESNDWIYPLLHRAGRMMWKVSRMSDTTPWSKRAKNQMARELLLAQSSDWAFILNAGTASQYAEARTRQHIDNVFRLFSNITELKEDKEWLAQLEANNSIFSEIDSSVYTLDWINT